jgi:hypothetical protein
MFAMVKHLSGRISLFLYVRTHSQLQYYLNLEDSHRAANQAGNLDAIAAAPSNVAEIHPLGAASLRRRG